MPGPEDISLHGPIVTPGDLPDVVTTELGSHVVKSLVWRSGSQIFAQLFTWSATFIVIRLLAPADYGVFAMTSSVLVLLSMLSGGSFANALIRAPTIDQHHVRQVLGLLILLNGTLAILQFLLAPAVAAYYRQPIVADLLRTQCLIYLANPPLALSVALLSRKMDFRAQAMANFASAFAGAGTALTGAMAGWGVWTLVFAPIAMIWTRAIGMSIAARPDFTPSFRFAGAGATMSFGLAVITSQLLWFVQTQSDIFIGGRFLDARHLGLYSTALFLAQLLTSKFVPPMNEIAYSAYARLQDDRPAIAAAFVRSTGMIMLVSLPFYAGMALTAEPLVQTVLGPHWVEVAPLIHVLAWVMPFVTLQILFAPVTNALGKPRMAVYSSLAGAIIMTTCFAVGVHRGATGLAEAWLFGFPLLTIITAAMSLPVIGLNAFTLLKEIARPLVAAAAMAAIVATTDRLLPPLLVTAHLLILVLTGFVAFATAALIFARPILSDILTLARRSRR
ncbi:lipopolysaccharide biosynthesis protein [Sphingomonas sp.]|uniref:lipopolysaccharide biosynthesis protein n=1 Tax=Sphingomonas sp. TaxID=28214 RepID=UPI0025F36638|nr:lipopolysaccharide biosynthesis protein [Sphingomonas sp.]